MKLRSTKKQFGGLLVGCLMTCGLIAGTNVARAADPVTIGVLDEAKLGEGYTKYRNAMDDLDRRAKAVQNQVLARRFLSPDEGKRFDELTDRKKTRVPAEETELLALVKTGTDRSSQYGELSGKAAPSAEELANLKKMQDYQKANTKAADDLEDDAFQLFKTQQDATDKLYIENANAMVQKVASDKKLTVLLRKDAIVWFTPTIDITEEVLKKLNQQ